MPLYEYICSTCEDDFTLLQSVHIKPGETICPECGSTEVVKQMSAFAPKVPSGFPSSGPPAGGCGMPPGGGGCGGGACGM